MNSMTRGSFLGVSLRYRFAMRFRSSQDTSVAEKSSTSVEAANQWNISAHFSAMQSAEAKRIPKPIRELI